MKRRIMVAATGLSAGTLVAVSVVNPRLVSDLVRVELVKAEYEEWKSEVLIEEPEILTLTSNTWKFDLGPFLSSNARIIGGYNGQNNVEVCIETSEGIKSYGTASAGIIEIQNIMEKSDMVEEQLTKVYSGTLIVKFQEEHNVSSDRREVTVKQSYQIRKTEGIQFDEYNKVEINEGDELNLDQLVKYAHDEFGADIKHSIKYSDDSKIVDSSTPGVYPIRLIFDGYGGGFSCTITVKENGDTKEPIEPIIKTKDVNLDYGEKWSNELGFDYAKDGEGKSIPIDDLYIVGGDKIDPFSPNIYYVKYYYKEGSDIFDTSIVTVGEKKTDTSETDTDDENTGSGAGGNTTSNIKEIDTTNIMTDKELLDIYDENGIKTGEKLLSDQTTDFVTNEENEVGGNKYYIIGNNEWVMAKDVKVFDFSNSNVQTHGDSFKGLTKLNSIAVTDRGLEKTTDWYTDRSAYFENELHHRVATHEWVHDDHVVKYQSVSGLVHTDETAQLYNSQGEKWTDRALAKNAIFFTDKKATINGKLMYRVATDEWVDADTVTFK
ncbi:SLAP domain-containing protein [Companilactobacillus muriivasis]|uniref:SLAP domain-containing protein n=1 Tax=Companilactobacillus muriivasis TaxID=3081444 RepID=UPI0030C66030